MKRNLIALMLIPLMAGCEIKRNVAGVWEATDGQLMSAFLGKTSSENMYCLELNPAQNSASIRFLDGSETLSVELKNTSSNSYELVKDGAKRPFTIQSGVIKDSLMINFLDSTPINLTEPGNRDAYRMSYTTLDECVRETLAQLKEDTRQAYEEPTTESQTENQNP